MGPNARNAPDIIEDDEAFALACKHPAGFEYGAGARTVQEIGELPLPHKAQRRGFSHTAILWLPSPLSSSRRIEDARAAEAPRDRDCRKIGMRHAVEHQALVRAVAERIHVCVDKPVIRDGERV
jgi:hypothetical protein